MIHRLFKPFYRIGDDSELCWLLANEGRASYSCEVYLFDLLGLRRLLFDLFLGSVSEVLDRLSQQSSFAEPKPFQLFARADVLINHMVDDGCLVRQSLHAD